jgi:hypothetical protein
MVLQHRAGAVDLEPKPTEGPAIEVALGRIVGFLRGSRFGRTRSGSTSRGPGWAGPGTEEP